MFIYEKNGSICVTFKGNKPVDAPEYVITIDKENQSVYVNGQKFVDPVEEPAEVAQPVEKKPAKRASRKPEPEVPVVEEAAAEETVTE